MRRLLITLGTCAATLTVAVALLWGVVGDRAVEAGRQRDQASRFDPRDVMPPAGNALPRVVWLGDSTLMHVPGHLPSYARRVQALQQGRVLHQVRAFPGLNPYHFYYLMGPITEQPPDLVVLIANLRQWFDAVGQEQHVPLVRNIPSGELPRASLLPFGHRRVRLAQLLLMRTLEVPGAMTVYHFAEGLRARFEDDAARAWLGGPDPLLKHRFVAAVAKGEMSAAEAKRRMSLPGYDRKLRPSEPMVRMLEAAVDLGVGRGARVLVIVSPIPHESLLAENWYDPDAYDRRVDGLRRVVEGAGGDLLDLHRELPAEAFRDLLGHFNESGIDLMRDRIAPKIEAQLRAPVRRHP